VLVVLKALLIGIVEGLTEFLPVSSTGHLLIVEHLLNCHQSEAFNVLIQVGPIVAAVVVFRTRIMELFTGWNDPPRRDELIKISACFLLTGVAGLAAKKLGLELPDTVLPVALATLIGAFVIFWAEARAKGKAQSESISWGVVVVVAAGQMLAAVFPGTSRSGAAILGAMLLGLARPAAVRFAFLVGIPTMFAAGGLNLAKAIRSGQAAELVNLPTLVAFVAATLTAWVSVVWLLRFVQHRTFIPFAWYRLALGALLVVLVAAGVMR
jgi:undecaprenyl-diphosphatase